MPWASLRGSEVPAFIVGKPRAAQFHLFLSTEFFAIFV